MTTNNSNRIYLSPPHMSGVERQYVEQAFDSNMIAPLGPMVDAFEREVADYTGIPYCLALSSGTAAMHLALRHVIRRSEVGGRRSEIGGQATISEQQTTNSQQHPRPVVVASTLTFIGSVTPATFEGCELRFIDCDQESWNMDPALLEEELESCKQESRSVAAVIPTDLYGQCCNLPQLRKICDKYGVFLIADAAEAMGSHYHTYSTDYRLSTTDNGPPTTDHRPPTTDQGTVSRHAGFDADAAVFSFNGNKIITTSGGGMLASHDKDLIEHARKLSAQAREPVPHYEHSEIGFNYRMSNIVAAIGRGQLEILEERVRQKRAVFDTYKQLLGDLPGISFMPEATYNRANRWLTVLLVDEHAFGATPTQIRQTLEAKNIEARPVWKPMHRQPVFSDCKVRGGAVAEEFFDRGLCLPSGTALRTCDVERIADIIRSCQQR